MIIIVFEAWASLLKRPDPQLLLLFLRLEPHWLLLCKHLFCQKKYYWIY